MKLLKSMDKWIWAKRLLSVMIVAVFAGIVVIKSGIYFDTNDDRVMAEILSGSLFGSPDGHVVYVNYLMAVPIMLLYRLTVSVPWWGVWCLGLYIIALFLITDGILQKAKDRAELFVLALSCVFLIFGTTHSLGKLQFTSVAATLSWAGYLYLVLREYSPKTQVIFGLSQLLALFLRQDAMLMMQPIGILVFACDMLAQGKIREKKTWRQVFSCGIILAFVLLLGTLGDVVGYSSEEWQEYERYNEAGTAVKDYYGDPDYEDVQDILAKYQVTERDYRAMKWYMDVKSNMGSECLEEVADYAKGQYIMPNIGQILRKMWDVTVTDDWLAIGRRVVGMWVIAVGCLVLFQEKKMLLPLSGLLVARTFIWIYLIYRGRIPYRVIHPLFYCELFFLFAICLKTYQERKRKGIVKAIVLMACVALGAVNLKSASIQLQHCVYSNGVQEILMEGLRDIVEYCEAHPDNRYILDNGSSSDCAGSVFETSIYRQTNFLYSGGWYSHSPGIMEYCEEYLGNMENVHLIVFDSGEDSEMERWQASSLRLEELTGNKPVEVDRLKLDSGGEYVIFKY